MYVKLCRVYPWRGYSSDHWYEETFLCGGPTAMRYLYKYMPRPEFLQQYWMECIEYDIVKDVPLPPKFDSDTFLNMLSRCGPRAAAYCYGMLPEAERDCIGTLCLESCRGNHRVLRWVLDMILATNESIWINDRMLKKEYSRQYYEILYEYRTRISNKHAVFYIRERVHEDERIKHPWNLVKRSKDLEKFLHKYRLPCFK
jgi:hypothetical protein